MNPLDSFGVAIVMRDGVPCAAANPQVTVPAILRGFVLRMAHLQVGEDVGMRGVEVLEVVEQVAKWLEAKR